MFLCHEAQFDAHKATKYDDIRVIAIPFECRICERIPLNKG